MATMLSTTTIPTAVVATATTTTRRKTNSKVRYITGLGSFGGLKASNKIANLGLPVCTNHQFSLVLNSLRSNGKGSRGGALTSTCNAAEEIFRIAAVMNGLVLVGVAVGFVLLRIEASVEEAE